MPNRPVTRRDVLRAGAAALPLAAASKAFSQAEKTPSDSSPGVSVGIATTRFRDYTNSRLAAEFRDQHVRMVQLFLTQSDRCLSA